MPQLWWTLTYLKTFSNQSCVCKTAAVFCRGAYLCAFLFKFVLPFSAVLRIHTHLSHTVVAVLRISFHVSVLLNHPDSGGTTESFGGVIN